MEVKEMSNFIQRSRMEYSNMLQVLSSGGARNLGQGGRLKDKIGNKKLININNKISKELYDNLIVIQNLT